MNSKDIILFISLISNGFMFYEYFNLIKKIQFIETKYLLLENQIDQNREIPFFINYNDLYFYGSVALLFILFIVIIQNNNFDSINKMNEYQEDNLKILSEIVNNTNLEKTEHIFYQLQKILTNQQILLQNLENYNNISFIADPSAHQLAVQLLQVTNL